MKKWIFFLIVGLVMLFYSTGIAGGDGEVRCDGKLMLPGQVCEYTDRSGHVTSRQTYDEVKEADERAHHTFVTWGRWALLGGGLALCALGTWGIVRHRRRAKAAGPSTANPHAQQAAAAPHPGWPPYPPHQQYPQPGYPPGQPGHPQQPQAGYPPQQPQAGHPPQPAAPVADFGPGAGDDVTQRLR